MTSDSEVKFLEQQIRTSLSQLGYSQLNAIECSAQADEVLLTGQLDSFYLKQVAQSVVVKIPGVQTVRNEIVVT